MQIISFAVSQKTQRDFIKYVLKFHKQHCCYLGANHLKNLKILKKLDIQKSIFYLLVQEIDIKILKF